MKIYLSVDTRIGRLVRFFVLSDLILIAGWGLVEPIFSIFILLLGAGVAFFVYKTEPKLNKNFETEK